MISKTVARIEAAIKRTRAGRRDDKDELVALLRKLKDEVKALDDAQKAQMRSVASFVEAATRHSGPPKLSRDVMRSARNDLMRYELAHPRLVAALNDLSVKLSELGI